MSPSEVALVLAIGLAGGMTGGLLGIGGSVVMLPLLTLLLGQNQQLYQAACMPVNVVVALGALKRHIDAGTIRGDWIRWLLPTTAVAAIVGVLVGNRVEGESLARLFGAFLLYVAISEVIRLCVRRDAEPTERRPASRPAAIGIGAATGGIAGLLGVGGGVVAVPLLRAMGKVPMREAIATSTAVIIVASTIGATAKNLTISSLADAEGTPLTVGASLTLAALLAPAAMFGGAIGSRLTYALPLGTIRVVFALFIALAGLRMLGVVA